MRFNCLPIVRPDFDVRANHALLAYELAKAGIIHQRATVSHPGFNNYIRLHAVDNFLRAARENTMKRKAQ